MTTAIERIRDRAKYMGIMHSIIPRSTPGCGRYWVEIRYPRAAAFQSLAWFLDTYPDCQFWTARWQNGGVGIDVEAIGFADEMHAAMFRLVA